MGNNGIERVKRGQTRGRSMGRDNKPQKTFENTTQESTSEKLPTFYMCGA